MSERIGEPTGPHNQKIYQQEYQHGADLFQRALNEHVKSQNMYQKEEFKEVMDKAMLILNETAREMKQQKLLEQNQQIEKDYEAYKSSPNPKTKEALDKDLQHAKGNFHMPNTNLQK